VAEAEGTVEKRDEKKKKKEEIEKKLEEFYKKLEEEGSTETLEDIKHLAYESRQLLRKVDTLVELLLEAAESEDEEEEKQTLMNIVKELQELREQLKGISDLRHILDGISETQKDLMEKINELEASLTRGMDVHFSDLSQDIERLKELIPVMDDLRDYIKRQMEEKDWLEKEMALLEKEITALSDAFNAFQKLVKGDIEERKKAMEDINKRAEDIIARIMQLRATLPEEESKRISALEGRLVGLIESVNTLLQAIKSEEENHRKLVESLVEQVKTQLETLTERVEELEHNVDVIGKEDISGVKEELGKLEERVTSLVSLLQKNGEAMKKHSSDVAEILMNVHQLMEKLENVEKVVNSRLSIIAEKLSVFENVDARLRELEAAIAEMRKEMPASSETKEIKKTLSVVHAEISTILDVLQRYDVLGELDSLREEIKKALDALSKGVMSKEETSAKLEEINRRVSEIEQLLNSLGIENTKGRLEEISKKLDAVQKSLGKASAVLTEEDLRSIVREVEELRAKIRLLRDAGVYTELEKIAKNLAKINAKALNVVPTPSSVKEDVKKVRASAELAADVAKEKGKALKEIKKGVQELGKKGGNKTAAHLVLKRVERLDRTIKAMQAIEKLSRDVEKKLGKIEKTVDKKHLRAVVGDVDADAAATRVVAKFIRRMRPGERVDLETLGKKTGISESLLKRVVYAMARSGEFGIKVRRPYFFGKLYIERLR